MCAPAPRPTVTPHRPPSISDVASLDRGVQHILYNDLKDRVPKEGCKTAPLKCDYIDYTLATLVAEAQKTSAEGGSPRQRLCPLSSCRDVPVDPGRAPLHVQARRWKGPLVPSRQPLTLTRAGSHLPGT